MINLSTPVTLIANSDASFVRRILGEMVEVSCLNKSKPNGQKIRGLDKRTFHNAMIVMKNIEHILTTQNDKEEEIAKRLHVLRVSEEQHQKEKNMLEADMIRLEQENDRLRAQLLERDLAL